MTMPLTMSNQVTYDVLDRAMDVAIHEMQLEEDLYILRTLQELSNFKQRWHVIVYPEDATMDSIP